MDFSSYSGVLFDVDKTLTDSTKQIRPITKKALHAVAAEKRIGICTGRHYTTLHQDTLPLFPKEALHVVSGGAQVISTQGEILWEDLIPYKTVTEILAMMDGQGTRIYTQTGSQIYGNDKAIAEWKVIIGDKHPLHILPLSMMPEVGIPIIVVHEIDSHIFETFLTRGDIEAKWMKNYTGKYYADITSKGVNKAVGLRKWCELSGIPASQVIGFGDSENDIEFLQACGYAVAMGNALPEVQEIADEVIDSCDEDGVAKWITQQMKGLV